MNKEQQELGNCYEERNNIECMQPSDDSKSEILIRIT